MNENDLIRPGAQMCIVLGPEAGMPTMSAFEEASGYGRRLQLQLLVEFDKRRLGNERQSRGTYSIPVLAPTIAEVMTIRGR